MKEYEGRLGDVTITPWAGHISVFTALTSAIKVLTAPTLCALVKTYPPSCCLLESYSIGVGGGLPSG